MENKLEDIIEAKPLNFTRQRKQFDKKWKQRILKIIRETNRPLNVREITKRLNHGTWITVKQALVDLEVEGKVEHFRSGHALLFRLKKETSSSKGLSGDVKVTLENEKVVFRTIVNGKNMKATLPTKDIHSYLQKSNKKIVENFRKVFGVTVDADLLKEKILKLLQSG